MEFLDSPRSATRLIEDGVLTNPPLRERGKSVTGRVRTETNTNRQAGPMHPIAAQRERHRAELGRRFGLEIARYAATVTRDWKDGTIVLIAEQRLLALVKRSLRGRLGPGIKVKEVAKDLGNLTAARLNDHLAKVSTGAPA
jgi:protein required for attachment to host cells